MTSAPRRVWPVVVAVQLGVLLAALDSTVVGTAMPTVIAALGGVALYPWVFSAYMLAMTAVMPVFGGVSDRLGRRGPFLAGVAVFCVGSLLAGVAPSMGPLIAGRAIQGVGAGGILALALIIFGDLFPGARRGRMQALITAVWGVASVAGPLLGGLVVDHGSWRWLFLMNVPLGVVVTLLVLAGLRETAPAVAGRGLDLAGATVSVIGVTALLYAVLEPALGGPARLGAALAGVAALAGFVRIERASPHPLLDLDLFRDATFTVACTAGFFSSAAMFGAIVHVPLLIQWGRGTDATTAGIALMVASLGWSAGGLVAGQIVNTAGFRALAVLGMALMTAAYLGLALRPEASFRFLVADCAALGVGMGLVSIVLIVAVQTLVARARRGIATGAVLFFRNVGATMGVAAMGATLTGRLGREATGLVEGAAAVPAPLGAAIVREMGLVFWLGVGAAVLGLIATWFLPRGTPVTAAMPEEIA